MLPPRRMIGQAVAERTPRQQRRPEWTIRTSQQKARPIGRSQRGPCDAVRTRSPIRDGDLAYSRRFWALKALPFSSCSLWPRLLGRSGWRCSVRVWPGPGDDRPRATSVEQVSVGSVLCALRSKDTTPDGRIRPQGRAGRRGLRRARSRVAPPRQVRRTPRPRSRAPWRGRIHPRAHGPASPRRDIAISVRRPVERIAPFAPVNPSGFASGVLRFAPALRVTGAKPGGGGLIEFISRAGLSSLSAFLRRARLR